MVKKIAEAVIEYKKRIDAVDTFEKLLIDSQFAIKKEDAFELGGTWQITHPLLNVATFEWNIPYYLTLSVNGKLTIDEDYLRSEQDWSDTLGSCAQILKSMLEQKK